MSPIERQDLASWLTPAEVALFDDMHPADRRHGLDVARDLRARGVDDRDVLVAGLLHDAGKGDVGVWPRIAWSLGERYGRWVWRLARILPGFGPAIDRLARHVAESAALAAAAGCSPRTVALIGEHPLADDRRFGDLLKLADEAN